MVRFRADGTWWNGCWLYVISPGILRLYERLIYVSIVDLCKLGNKKRSQPELDLSINSNS